jgi:hypothetical protein
MPDAATPPAASRADLPLELQVLELFGQAGLVVLGPTDVERLTGISKGTASARLRAMAEAGYLQSAGPGKYQPGPKVFHLAMGYMGLIMGRIDEARRMLDCDLGQIQAALSQLSLAMPGAKAGRK